MKRRDLLQKKLDDFISCLFESVALIKNDTKKQKLIICADSLKTCGDNFLDYSDEILDSLERTLISEEVMEKMSNSNEHEAIRGIFEDILPLPELEEYMEAKDMESVTVTLSKNKRGELIVSSADYII